MADFLRDFAEDSLPSASAHGTTLVHATPLVVDDDDDDDDDDEVEDAADARPFAPAALAPLFPAAVRRPGAPIHVPASGAEHWEDVALGARPAHHARGVGSRQAQAQPSVPAAPARSPQLEMELTALPRSPSPDSPAHTPPASAREAHCSPAASRSPSPSRRSARSASPVSERALQHSVLSFRLREALLDRAHTALGRVDWRRAFQLVAAGQPPLVTPRSLRRGAKALRVVMLDSQAAELVQCMLEPPAEARAGPRRGHSHCSASPTRRSRPSMRTARGQAQAAGANFAQFLSFIQHRDLRAQSMAGKLELLARVAPDARRAFKAADRNGSGKLDATELAAALTGLQAPVRSLACCYCCCCCSLMLAPCRPLRPLSVRPPR